MPRRKVVINKRERIRILKRARALIEAGWVRGRWTAPGGPNGQRYCLGAACQKAAREVLPQNKRVYFNTAMTASDRVAREISLHEAARARGFSSVPGFNDHGFTEKKDIIDLIDAKLEEEKT
jgi:hypothetical protein